MGHLRVVGFGAGTRLVASNSESALVFENCASVIVRDLYAETGRVGDGRTNARYLNGTLTFRNCPAVELEAVALRCGQGPERGAACITVDQAAPTSGGHVEAGTVRIRHCDLRVGHQQVGILLLNVTRSHVEDNVVRVRNQTWSLHRLLQNRRYRGGVRRLVIANGQVDIDDEDLVGGTPEGHALVTHDGMTVMFETDSSLEDTWQTFINFADPQGIQSQRDLYFYLKNIASRMLSNDGLIPVGNQTFTGFENWYSALRNSNLAVGSQGIVVGGTTGRDIRILNNTVLGVLQGIHLGLDDRTRSGRTLERLGTVRVRGNTIGIIISPYLRARHGLFVGHCDNLLAEDNDIRVRRLPVTQDRPIEGVLVIGEWGRKMVVRQNYVRGFSTGIRVRGLNDPVTGNPQWVVTDNTITDLLSGGTRVSAFPGQVASTGNDYD